MQNKQINDRDREFICSIHKSLSSDGQQYELCNIVDKIVNIFDSNRQIDRDNQRDNYIERYIIKQIEYDEIGKEIEIEIN